MSYTQQTGAGTVFHREEAGVLDSIFVAGGAAGMVTVYDAAEAPLPGTALMTFAAGTADTGIARNLGIAVSNGIAVVLSAATAITVAHSRRGR